MNNILDIQDGYFCTKCKSLCYMYSQGLKCECDQPLESERVRVEIQISKKEKVNSPFCINYECGHNDSSKKSGCTMGGYPNINCKNYIESIK